MVLATVRMFTLPISSLTPTMAQEHQMDAKFAPFTFDVGEVIGKHTAYLFQLAHAVKLVNHQDHDVRESGNIAGFLAIVDGVFIHLIRCRIALGELVSIGGKTYEFSNGLNSLVRLLLPSSDW